MDINSNIPAVNIDDYFVKYLPFLSEIRKRLFFVLAVFLIANVLGFIYYQKIVTFALSIFNLKGINIVFTSPFQFLTLAFSSSLLVATIVSFPLILFQVLSFLKPALRPREYTIILLLLPISLVLFIAGFGFGLVTMRYLITWFYQSSTELQIGNVLDVSKLFSQVLLISTIMGIAFQFPIIVTILVRLKVITYHVLEKRRLWAHSALFIFAAILPPADLLTTIILFIPLAVLFELTLLVNRWILKSHLL